MGLENDDFPFTFRTAHLASSHSAQQFAEGLLAALDAHSDLFLSNVFSEEAVQKHPIDLDDCFIPSGTESATQTRPSLGDSCLTSVPC
jgi:hypothetical protein